TSCPKCESDLFRFFGTGTERVEEALTKLMPELSIIRMDVDTTRRKGAHERLLKKFANKEADVLFGTRSEERRVGKECRARQTRSKRDWRSDVCSSDLDKLP